MIKVMISINDIEEKLKKEKEKDMTVRFTFNKGLFANKHKMISEKKIDELNEGEKKYLKKMIEKMNDNDFVY